MKFKDRVAIVTGSGQGIGRAIAYRLASGGASVIISDKNLRTAEQTAEEIRKAFNTRTYSVATDVRKRDDVYNLIKFTVENFGRINILVNNAGICPLTKVQDITQEEWDEVLEVNLRGGFFCCQAVTPIMKKQREGKILNIASTAGNYGAGFAGFHYSASKAGLICLTKDFAKELASFGVNVNAIAPGPIDTPLSRSLPAEARDAFVKRTQGWLGVPEDVADAAEFLLSDAAKTITGRTIEVNAGLIGIVGGFAGGSDSRDS
jgi:3-oxoacyl-[acyl-carrier protein] reductase